MLRVIFWVVPRRVVFDNRRFGTLCLFRKVGQVDIYSPMKMEQTQCSETSVIKHHTPGNNPNDYTLQRVKYFANSSYLFCYVFLVVISEQI
jgi:hypothetical protein